MGLAASFLDVLEIVRYTVAFANRPLRATCEHGVHLSIVEGNPPGAADAGFFPGPACQNCVPAAATCPAWFLDRHSYSDGG